FDSKELYKAIYALSAQKQINKPPSGEIVGVRVGQEDGNRVFIKIENDLDDDAPETEVEYNRDFMAAALMLYCRGLGIPLPKTATKSVLIKDDQVMLRVQI
ncbi:MAG: hypothetical protein AAF182_04040, partial [Pseudomonadota bacterium]